MARRHPATERFRGSATGSRRSPGLRLEMDMRGYRSASYSKGRFRMSSQL